MGQATVTVTKLRCSLINFLKIESNERIGTGKYILALTKAIDYSASLVCPYKKSIHTHTDRPLNILSTSAYGMCL